MITAIIAILYKAYGTLPQVQPFIIGTKPAIIAIIVGAIYPLAKKTYKTKQLILLGCLTFFLALSGYNEIAVMFSIGMLAILSAILFPTLSLSSSSSSSSSTSISSSSQSSPTRQQTTLPLAFTAIRNLAGVSTTGLFLTFLKIGATLYGSGYVLFALLDNELVAKGLLSRQQLVDAIAVGQFTPGPVFSSVTFIGYQLNGYAGAFVSTIGVFLPSFFFVGLLKPLVIRLKTSRLFKVFLDAINAASIAIIALICVSMAHSLGVDYKLIVMLLLFIPLVLLLPKINSCWFILAGSLLGYLLNVCSI